MAEIGSLVDLLLFYTVERALFNRMVGTLGKNPQQVKTTIALWLLLEEIGYHDLIRTINYQNNKTIEALFNEALLCLEYIQPDKTEPAVLHHTPVFEETKNYSRDFMCKRYMHIMETVCDKIFGESGAIEVDESGTRPVLSRDRPFGKGCYAHIPEAARESNLNPEASKFYPEDVRTMFLTFSRGHPLTREEIINFFISKWGDVVQDVFIERTRPGQDPQFGRIVFTTSTVIPRVLNGQSRAKFLVNPPGAGTRTLDNT
ncbi:hypothetical protein KPL70_006319 [Citrus sinensis]|nr:hypothetical protein KPL70_006319 [Citrus sinensis]